MYDQSFRNQAVKECVNGQTMRATARKYGISDTALRAWINEYKKRIAVMARDVENSVEKEPEHQEPVVVASEVKLNSINITVDGYEVTISKKDVVKLMEIFYHFDK